MFSTLLGISLPLIKKKIESSDAQSFVSKVYLLLHYAKTHATVTNETIFFTVDTEEGFVILSGIGREKVVRKVAIPQSVRVETDREKNEIVFYPDGSMMDFSLIVTRDNKIFSTISSNGADGKIRVD